MARCEDYPCCGHELGCCPDYDEAGRQLNMKCTCGATVPLSSSSSLCKGCLSMVGEDSPWPDPRNYDPDDDCWSDDVLDDEEEEESDEDKEDEEEDYYYDDWDEDDGEDADEDDSEVDDGEEW